MKHIIYIVLTLIIISSCGALKKENKGQMKNKSSKSEANISIDFFQTEWELVRIGAIKPKITSTDNKVSILFGRDNSHFAGFSGCNRYFGKFEIKKDNLKLMDIGSTMMACPDNDMSFERNYLQTLNKVTNYSIVEDTLYLKNKERIILTFIAR